MEDNNQTNNRPESTTSGLDPLVNSSNAEGGVSNEVTTSGDTVVGVTESNTTTEKVETVPEKNASQPEVVPQTTMVSETLVTESTSQVVTEPAVSNGATTTNKKMLFVQYGIATLIVLVMGAGLTYALEKQGRINTGIFAKINELMYPAPAAATVNGVKISLADYDKNANQLTQAATSQGADVTSETVKADIKKQAIDVLVNTELLKQAAAKAGIVVTADQVATRRGEIVTTVGGEDKLKEKMVELGITEESLAKDISGEILIQAHLKNAVDTSKVAVSPEELKAAYDQIVSGQKAGDVPPFDQIKSQLEAQLLSNKQQELVNNYITSLRDGADVKILI